MLSDEQKEQLATEIVPLFQELEQDVIKDIARRVHKTGGRKQQNSRLRHLKSLGILRLRYRPRYGKRCVLILIIKRLSQKTPWNINTRSQRKLTTS